VWSEKPAIGLGNSDMIKEIFHIPVYYYTGIPPGIIAEFYWNFGILGVVVGMCFLGYVLKTFYKSLLPYIQVKNKNAIVLYLYIGYSLGFLMPGTSFAPSIVNLLMGIIPLILALCFVNISIFQFGKKPNS